MKKLLSLAVLLFAVGSAQAGPYFRFEPFKEISNGAFFKLGDPQDNVLLGQKTSIITHHMEDGYLLVPGVTWNLLDIGWAIPVNAKITSAYCEIGPSVNLSEPIKAALRYGLHFVKDDLGFMDRVLAPGQSGWALNAGPGLGVQMSDTLRGITGRFTLHVGLGAKF